MAITLLDWIADLMRNAGAREAFAAQPQLAMASAGFTQSCGSGEVSPAFYPADTSFREVQGVSVPDTVQDVTYVEYVINNYTYTTPAVSTSEFTGPTTIIDNPEPSNTETQGANIEGDGNTVDANQSNTVDQSSSDDDTTTDESTNTDQDADNVVTGDHSAGGNQIAGGIDDVGEGISGSDNLNVITLADVVDIEDSPILNRSLNDAVDDSLNEVGYNLLQNAENLINILG
ncbi:hypothetical protein GCM10009547_25940 [Sporichthya brevicatena]|uniref:Uncharacterized protein n=1 Tax=Sporichthya brevicatena TaxID=171442 RepID=A0ABN1GWQ9_9ACTN